ncbi:MAG: type II toxin-antitoxin system RelE/ParE family toxin [Candidatus Korobacteraceae bacterium]
MAWKVELSAHAERNLDDLDAQPKKRILKFLFERLARLDDPRGIGQALQGQQFGELWRYRVGDYRLICEIQDQRLVVVVVKIGHRREVYRY